MTEPTYLLTEADKDYFIKCIKTLCTGSHSDVTKTAQTLQGMLQSLHMVSGEPVAWTWDTMGSGGMSGYRIAHFQINKPKKTTTMFDLTPLYTSPQALTPITADDVTPAMLKEWNKIFGLGDMSVASPKDGEIMAAAYNAVIKHRSEAK